MHIDFIFNLSPGDIIYDIETYPNYFSFGAQHSKTLQYYYFEISDRANNIAEICYFIDQCKQMNNRWVGYNNIGFDYPVIHYIYQNQIFFNDDDIIKNIYDKAMSIINARNNDEKFKNLIWDSDQLVKQIDLYKIHHFDNAARSTSLKTLEFNMRMDNIEDLPFDVGVNLNSQQMDIVKKYHKHDIDATLKFYNKSKQQLEFREQLTKKYNKNFINHNDTKIGKEYFIMELEKAEPGACYRKIDGKKHVVQTKRDIIKIKSIILPYIKFNNPELHNIHQWLNQFSISKTKEALAFLNINWKMCQHMDHSRIKVYGLDLSDLPNVHDSRKTLKILKSGIPLTYCYTDLLNHSNPEKFQYVSGSTKKSGLNTILNGFQFDFGTGGIHGSVESQIIHSNKDMVILDLDVASYYPNLAIANNLYPEHLGQLFCDIYKDVYEERKKYPKGTTENDMLKLALNGVYGDSNNQYSPFYDPQYTMAITINGQLLLCMLAESLMRSPDIQLIQINTDGLTIKTPRKLLPWIKSVQTWWEKLTNLQLESVEYNRMFIRDVNNYIAEYTDGRLKRKGAYEYDLGWHQNHSSLIVPKAAEAFLAHNKDISKFIHEHSNVFDFFLRAKVPRSNSLQYEGNKVANIIRYYISNQGGKLQKIMPPTGASGKFKRKNGITDKYYSEILNHVGSEWDGRIHTKNKSIYQERRSNIHPGWDVKICNDLRNSDWVKSNNHPCDLNYKWYIKETIKLVSLIKEND